MAARLHEARPKDVRKLAKSNLKEQALELLKLLEEDPFQNPPPYEQLVGDLAGAYSRRINIQHRLVYQVLPNVPVVKVIRLWTHHD
jgi:Txe/YoeB family toxin of toxin-antitoxin system